MGIESWKESQNNDLDRKVGRGISKSPYTENMLAIEEGLNNLSGREKLNQGAIDRINILQAEAQEVLADRFFARTTGSSAEQSEQVKNLNALCGQLPGTVFCQRLEKLAQGHFVE